MLQCSACEFGKAMPNGNIEMTCNPARTVKEEACLTKWMLVRLCNVERMQAQMMSVSNGMMPLHAKVLQHNCSQIDELQKGDEWKRGGADDDESAA